LLIDYLILIEGITDLVALDDDNQTLVIVPKIFYYSTLLSELGLKATYKVQTPEVDNYVFAVNSRGFLEKGKIYRVTNIIEGEPILIKD